jgi:hypothetical protein
LRHFDQANSLQQTIWKLLPIIAKGLTKKVFKRHLELFLDPLQMSLRNSNRLVSHAAGECVRQLSTFVGPSIFKGRLSPDMAAVMEPYLAH